MKHEPTRLVRSYFCEKWYSGISPDVAESGVDGFEHYLAHGHREGRDPHPSFASDWYRSMYMLTGDDSESPLEHYVRVGIAAGNRPNPIVDPGYLQRRYAIRPEDVLPQLEVPDADIDQLSAWFSRRAYLRANADVSSYEHKPEGHFLRHGLSEGRRPHPEYELRLGRIEHCAASPLQREIVQHFEWDEQFYFVERVAVPAHIVALIHEQGAFDTEIFAAGADCIPKIREFAADDLRTRDLYDFRRLLDAFEYAPEFLIILPRLGVGGAEKYASNLAQCVTQELRLRCTVLTTDSSTEENERARDLRVLRPLRSVQVLSLRDHISRTWKQPTVLALLLLHLAPQHVFVVNSELGLATIKTHGRSLSNVMKMFVTFFSESPRAIGAPYSARYLRSVVDYATIVADNRPVLDLLSDRLGEVVPGKFVELAQQVELPHRLDFDRALRRRVDARRSGAKIRLVWLSRWEKFKATSVLEALIERHPEFQLDCYGVPADCADFPISARVRNRGVVADPSTIDLEPFDAFIFTSWFEGMPNVVLEMAARGIPIICSNVGGLRDVFSAQEVHFVDMNQDVPAIADDFAAAGHAIRALSGSGLAARVRGARLVVEERHSAEAFTSRFESLLGQVKPAVAGAPKRVVASGADR